MLSYSMEGGNKVYGEVQISSAKNSALTVMCAAILNKEVFIKNCPNIGDVTVMSEILSSIGATVKRTSDGLYIDASNVYTTDLPKSKTSKIRASFFLVGPLLSRFGTVSVSKPGGCKIGERPVDIHLEGFKALGAKVSETESRFIITAPILHGAKIHLRYPSVGATENLILASACADGVTLLFNSAKEPEVKDLCDFLNLCGAKITGGGTSIIRIDGVKKLNSGITFKPLPDRIEAGTFLLLCYALGGKVELSGVKCENIYYLVKKILDNTCNNDGFYVKIYNDNIYIYSDGNPKGLGRFVTMPYPMFPTDLHPLVSAVGAAASGETSVSETVFDSRFSYLQGLKKMGADFTLHGETVTFRGRALHGETVTAPDLRGGAALVVAGLKAEGKTVVKCAENVMRGYEDFSLKLRKIGAKIKTVKES